MIDPVWLRFLLSIVVGALLPGLGWGQDAVKTDLPKAAAVQLPVLGALAATNPFDEKRQLWPDRTPAPPPPPVPAPVTSEDLQIYGVILVGGAQKALLKLGPRFKGHRVGPSGLASVPVGGNLGEFYLAQVQSDQILLKAPGGEQWVRFGGKTDRLAQPASVGNPVASGFGAPPAVVSVAPVSPPLGGAPGSALGNGVVQAPAGEQASQAGGTPMFVPGGAAAGQAADSATAPNGSLAAAIANARAGAGASAGAAPGGNPFEALLNRR